MPGPLWPGGPGELPAVVELCGQRYTVPAVPGMRLAWAVARFVPIIPDLLDQDQRSEVHLRLRHVTDPLDRIDTEQATVSLVADLAGIDIGVNGWRAAVRLCSALLADWPFASGALLSVGIDPGSAPLWRICSGLYWQFIENPGSEPDAVKQAKQQLFAPLRSEAAWMREVRPPPPLNAAAAHAGAKAMMEQRTGQRIDLSALCRVCGRMGEHTPDCPNAAA